MKYDLSFAITYKMQLIRIHATTIVISLIVWEGRKEERKSLQKGLSLSFFNAQNYTYLVFCKFWSLEFWRSLATFSVAYATTTRTTMTIKETTTITHSLYTTSEVLQFLKIHLFKTQIIHLSFFFYCSLYDPFTKGFRHQGFIDLVKQREYRESPPHLQNKRTNVICFMP